MNHTAARPVILVADNSTAVTGALIAMRNATDRLRHRYDFVYVLPTGSRGRPVLEAAGYRVHELPFVEISKRVRSLLLYVPMLLLNGWRLAGLVRREQAAVVHMNDFYNLTGVLARLLTGRPLVTHVRFLPHTQMQPLARTWRWVAEHLAQRVVCVSQAVYSYFQPLPHVRVIADPIPEQEKYPPTNLVPRPDGTLRVLYLSNYILGKGQNFGLEAFRTAYAANPRLRLHFAGGDMGLDKNRAYKQQLQEAAAAAGLGEVVTFGSFVQDVEAAIKEADIVLNFSESESFSLTCLDALFFGTPLIASDCGGPAELFENGRSGLLVPNRDVPAMAAALQRLAADADLRQQFAAAGRVFVRQKFNPASTYEQLGRLYDELLASRPA
ncbi:glycosyltransferase family 4 protein [Hymenobacter busanensis]|uniref:Glycosyltransferase family 4 protein n=1 Tax=Hymenobacter busanensis TaxID=2607656 RepID=A0A7L4ZX10_9BACT|nr:glycosyltransferase family 4 protein [Hymenobacter busanensis]KAA9332277.1 glycosyltransferase family 4 protein [Hymenobacter busanensis]QHJ07386.1 glycosyltransferase [Hymenobacter busanensis]